MPEDLTPSWWLVSWGNDNRRNALFNDEYTANYFVTRCTFPDDKARVYPVVTSQALHSVLAALA